MVLMGTETRGHAIKARRLAHGIKSVHELARKSGVSREAVTAAERGDASKETYERLEAWLDRFDEETGSDVPADPRVFTFRLEMAAGVVVAVSGPIDDIDKLMAPVERLMARLKPDTLGPADDTV